jgi:hypothetical protein
MSSRRNWRFRIVYQNDVERLGVASGRFRPAN